MKCCGKVFVRRAILARGIVDALVVRDVVVICCVIYFILSGCDCE